MPFLYACVPTAKLSSSASAATELANMAIRQTTRGNDILSLMCAGRMAAQTTLTGINFLARRWTTVGTSGNSLTPAPRRIGTTASTVVVDSNGTAITPGTVSGAYQVGFGCTATGPGGWVAQNPDAWIHTEAGSADEIAINSIQGGSTAMDFTLAAEIAE